MGEGYTNKFVNLPYKYTLHATPQSHPIKTPDSGYAVRNKAREVPPKNSSEIVVNVACHKTAVVNERVTQTGPGQRLVRGAGPGQRSGVEEIVPVKVREGSVDPGPAR